MRLRTGSRGGLAWLMIMAAALMLTGRVVVAADVDYTVTFPSSPTETGAESGADALKDAITAIEGGAVTTQPDYNAVVNIEINADQTSNPGGSNIYNSGWHLHGSVLGAMPNPYGTIKGFDSVTINGLKADGNAAVLTGATNRTLIKVVHVENDIDISKLELRNGNYTDDGTANGLGEVGGSGLMLGGNGVGGAHKAPSTISVSDVLLQGNSINITGDVAQTVGNAFGAGVYIVGIGATGAGPDETEGSSFVDFTDVNIKGNTINFTNANAGSGSSVRGGGGRVSYSDGFRYTRGEVSNNIIDAVGVGHASGGGLSVDGGIGFDQDVELLGVNFKDNQVIIDGPGVNEGWSSARGGGFYSLINNNDTGKPVLDIVFDKDLGSGTVTKFTGNKVTANGTTGDAIAAWGGGAFIYMNQANAKFNGIEFNANSATAQTGEAGGGAIAIDKYTELVPTVAKGKLTVTGSSFVNNSAKTTGANGLAYGGAIFGKTDSGTGHILSGNTYTGNSAQVVDAAGTVLAGGQAFGGAIAFNTGGQTLDGETFDGNFAKAASAYGGAAYFANGSNTVLDGEFTNNTISGITTEGKGGALFFGAIGGVGGNTITGTLLQGNKIESTANARAHGGAIYLTDGANTVTSTSIIGNSVKTKYSQAHGGGMYIASGDTTLDTVTISGNGATSEDNSKGGGIYYGGNGTLTLDNSSVTNNWLTTTDKTNDHAADGSGIYIFTGATGATLNLNAAGGKSTVISGNRINGLAAGEGVYFSGGDDATTNVTGSGTVILADGMTSNISGIFAFNKTGAGRLEWDGNNNIIANAGATLNLADGDVYLGKTFTARAGLGTDYTVTISKDASITFDASRDGSLAMFDFTGNGGAGDSMTVGVGGGKTTLSSSIGRSVYSQDKEYVVVSGMTDTNRLRDVMNGFDFQSADSPFISGGGMYIDGDKLIVGYKYVSPFDSSGPNAKSAQGPLGDLLAIQPPISDAEWEGVLRYARSAYPELYLDQAQIMVGAVDLMARSAVDYGLRYPHRSRMRTEIGYAPQYVPGETIGRYEDYGDPVLYRDGKVYDSTEAYPSAILDKCGSLIPSCNGLRLWAGYVGDWRTVDPSEGLNGYSVDRNGFLVGMNYDWGAAASIGVYGGYSKSTSEADRATSSIDSDTGHIGIQARVSPLANYREFSIYADAGYHFASNDFSRNLGGWGAFGSFDQKAYTAGLGLEHVFCLEMLNITPHAEFRFTKLKQDGMTEYGNSVTTTSIDRFNKNQYTSRVGFEMSHDFHTTRGVFSPAFNAAWKHEFGSRDFTSEAVYLNSPTPRGFDLTSSRVDRDSLDIGVAMKSLHAIGASNKMSVNVGYNLNLSRNSNTHSLYTGFELGF